ncbi:hypothetical protein CW713_10425 [Methanophagales archaeon]|nr:MAG: hypothetical protein CW713_10425 [Methanophagales archaeon]
MGCMIKADDGDGHTDTATVEILTAVPTPTPTPTPPPEVKPTPTPTPKPPGFEAVFPHFFFLEKKKTCAKRKTPEIFFSQGFYQALTGLAGSWGGAPTKVKKLLVKLSFLKKG